MFATPITRRSLKIRRVTCKFRAPVLCRGHEVLLAFGLTAPAGGLAPWALSPTGSTPTLINAEAAVLSNSASGDHSVPEDIDDLEAIDDQSAKVHALGEAPSVYEDVLSAPIEDNQASIGDNFGSEITIPHVSSTGCT